MNAASKENLLEATLEPSARLFGQLEEIFSTPSKKINSQTVSAGVRKTVRQMGQKASLEEILMLREVLRKLSSELEVFIPSADAGAGIEDLAAAEKEDAAVQRALEQVAEGKAPVFTTPESIRAGDKAMAAARQNEATTIQGRIKRGELIGSGQLQQALGIGRQAISNALSKGRMFAIIGPSGDNYYPSFYADSSLDRRVLEKVTRALGQLPATSKYHFFTSKFTALGESPLDALRKGRIDDVLGAASAFVER